MLLFVLDGSMNDGERNPVTDYMILMKELELYSKGILLNKPALIAYNKSDRKYT